MNKKIGLGITGSFCCHEQIKKIVEDLISKGYEITPILTYSVNELDTRFGKANELKNYLMLLTGKTPITTLQQAEPLGPKKIIDAIVIAPCTGNTLAKIANGISDNAVTMTTKSLMRNNKPVVIAISTNDAMGLNFQNLAKLYNTKGVYFVPFKQDDFEQKPKSLVANFDKIESTLKMAFENNQIQPVIE